MMMGFFFKALQPGYPFRFDSGKQKGRKFSAQPVGQRDALLPMPDSQGISALAVVPS